MWQWSNYLRDKIPQCKRALFLNLDETSICTFLGKVKGNIFVKKGLTQRVSKGPQRTYLTYVGIICDDPNFQPVIPQFILVNGHTLTAREIEGLRSACPSNVRLLREKSAWVNQELFGQMLQILGEALKPYLKRLQPILVFDTCRSHISRKPRERGKSNNGVQFALFSHSNK